jgi:outer membrane lipoprotein-sorting protein
MHLNDLLELLYTARKRFSSIQVSWQYRYNRGLMNAAQERWFSQQPPGSVGVLKSENVEKAGYPSESEQVIRRRVWWRKPSCWRREEQAARTMVKILCEDRFWIYWAAGGKLYTNVMPEDKRPELQIIQRKRRQGEQFTDLSQELREVPVIDPSLLLATHDLQLVENTVFAGRKAVRVQGVFRKGRAPGWEPHFWSFADEHEFLVDLERGILLRYAARFKGQEFAVAAVDEVIFDEPIPDSVFSFVPPPNTSVEVIN